MTTYDKVIKFIESDNFEINLEWINKKTRGEIKDDRISINIVLAIVQIFLHEYYHDRYASKECAEIDQLVYKAIDRMTIGQINRIYCLIMSRAGIEKLKF